MLDCAIGLTGLLFITLLFIWLALRAGMQAPQAREPSYSASLARLYKEAADREIDRRDQQHNLWANRALLHQISHTAAAGAADVEIDYTGVTSAEAAVRPWEEEFGRPCAYCGVPHNEKFCPQCGARGWELE